VSNNVRYESNKTTIKHPQGFTYIPTSSDILRTRGIPNDNIRYI